MANTSLTRGALVFFLYYSPHSLSQIMASNTFRSFIFICMVVFYSLFFMYHQLFFLLSFLAMSTKFCIFFFNFVFMHPSVDIWKLYSIQHTFKCDTDRSYHTVQREVPPSNVIPKKAKYCVWVELLIST